MTVYDYAEKKESIVFCEGYHDRDFWAGWLPRLGWSDARPINEKTGELGRASDPFGKPVVGGKFVFVKDRRFVRVKECKGAKLVVGDALKRIGQADPLHHVIINLDSDATDGGDGPAEKRLASLQGDLKAKAGRADREPRLGPHSYRLDSAIVSAVTWRVNDPPEMPGVPAKQTLERVVAASLAAAYPERALSVDPWLRAEPLAAVDGQGSILGKAYTWSYMAKWYPERGRDCFYRLIWEDAKVADELESRLRATGAWSIAEAL